VERKGQTDRWGERDTENQRMKEKEREHESRPAHEREMKRAVEGGGSRCVCMCVRLKPHHLGTHSNYMKVKR